MGDGGWELDVREESEEGEDEGGEELEEEEEGGEDEGGEERESGDKAELALRAARRMRRRLLRFGFD